MSRTLLLVALVALLPLVALARVNLDVIDASNIDAAFAEQQYSAQWARFKRTYGKVYESDEIEQHRFELFQANMRKAAELQRKNPSAKFGITKFSDLHPVEFKRGLLTFIPAVGDSALLRQAAPVSAPVGDVIPDSYDWRAPDKGRPIAVTPVKDQGQCGSCWAFSATEATESAWILAGHTPIKLSPQQTVDCDQVDQGCNGGDTVSAYQYIQGAGVEPDRDYPYISGETGNAGNCNYTASEVVAKISGFKYATPNCDDACNKQDEETLKQNLYEVGPVSICVDASTWQSYVSGILTSASGCSHDYNDLDHCVQLVGYGTDSQTGQKFWSVRNSWNTDWGEEGYIRLLYGENTCGVADEATQPTAA